MRRINAAHIAIACSITLVSILGCDNRYELSKDAAGNTVRLDKRTGEVAIIQEGEIKPLKDAAQADAERKDRAKWLEAEKSWDDSDIPMIGVHAVLSSLWRDGKIYYKLAFYDREDWNRRAAWVAAPLDKRGPPPLLDAKSRHTRLHKAMRYRPFTVELTDRRGFTIKHLTIGPMTNIVDPDNLTMNFEEQGTATMTEQEYEQLGSWALRWSGT